MPVRVHGLSTLVLAALAAFAITAVGQGLWGGLAALNLATTPAVPWAPLVMAGLLLVLLSYLAGRLGSFPDRKLRASLLPLRAAPAPVWVWSLIAGACGIATIAGLWITLGELFPAKPNLLPDISRYPRPTMLAFLAMAVIAAPVSEEAAFRGYAMGILRKAFPPVASLIVVAVLFALAHLTQGFYLTKLTVYFLAGLMFGVTARRAASLVPAMVVHSAADLTFFTLVWPGDAHRRHITLASADRDFWLQIGLTVAFGLAALAAYRKLFSVTPEPAP